MLDIIPFAGLRPHRDYVEEVVSLPYDVLGRDEARHLAQDKPYSFLRVIRSDLEFPNETSPYAKEVYERARQNLDTFRSKGVFIKENKRAYYIYSIKHRGGRQIGLVALFSVKDYQEGRIKKHELTRPEKEKDRITHIKTLKAHTGPVFLLYRDAKSKRLGQTLESYVDTQEALYSLNFSEEETIHSLYRVENKEDIEKIEASFAQLNCVYIADGHHRAASAAQAALSVDIDREPNKADNKVKQGAGPIHFLAAAFPDRQMQILPYYRVVRDLNHLSKEEFIQALAANKIQVQKGCHREMSSCQANMCLEGAWYRLEWESKSSDTLLESLAVNVLQNKILDPILGISDPRNSKRIAFVGGVHGEKKLESLVSAGNREFVLAFSMAAVKTEELLKIADAAQIMPPKSTWFEPKLRSGFIINSFEI